MVVNELNFDERGRLEVKPTSRLALLWSFNPVIRWKPPHQMVGSISAHVGHLEVYGAVYWNLKTKVSEEKLTEFDYPLSGYLYNSSSKSVEYRARIVDMSRGPREEFVKYVPMWRTGVSKREYLFILIDQIDRLNPSRFINEFCSHANSMRVESPPSGNYRRVKDPLY